MGAKSKPSFSKAVAAVAAKKGKNMSIRAAAKAYGVKTTALYNRVKGTVAIDARRGRPPVMREKEERLVVSYAIYRSFLGMGLTKKDLLLRIHAITSDGRKVPWGGKGPGDKWFKGFLDRHKSRISMRRSRIRESTRFATDKDSATIKQWFDTIAGLMAEKAKEQEMATMDPKTIWNMDETGIMLFENTKAPKVIAPCGTKRCTTPCSDSRESVTAVMNINANGEMINPFLVKKGIRYQRSFVEGLQAELESHPDDEDLKAAMKWSMKMNSESHMVNTDIFREWMKHFVKSVKEMRGLGPDDKLCDVLILDGHMAHIDLAALEEAKEAGVDVAQLPSHTTHVTQPLDVCALGPLKRKLGELLSGFHVAKRRNAIMQDMLPLLAKAVGATMTEKNLQASFRAAGLVPLDPNHVLDKLKPINERARAYHQPQELPIVKVADAMASNLSARDKRKISQRTGENDDGVLDIVRLATIMDMDKILRQTETAKRPKRARTGLTHGGVLTVKDVMDGLAAKEQETAAKNAAKDKRKAEREAKRAEKDRREAQKKAQKAAGATTTTKGAPNSARKTSKTPKKTKNSAQPSKETCAPDENAPPAGSAASSSSEKGGASRAPPLGELDANAPKPHNTRGNRVRVYK